MTRLCVLLAALVIAAVVAPAAPAQAQAQPAVPAAPPTVPAPPPPAPTTSGQPLPTPRPVVPTPSPTASPLSGATGSCVRRDKPAAGQSAISQTPVAWSDFDVEGQLRDPPATTRALFAPVMLRRTSLTDETRRDIAETAAKLGYGVVSLTTRDAPGGSRAVLNLSPLPLVRKVTVDIRQSPFATLLDDQVRRRMLIRAGSYLPADPAERRCQLDEEQSRIADYLHFEEGYFDATVEHTECSRGDGLDITIKVSLGASYGTGAIRVAYRGDASPIDPRTIVAAFRHDSSFFSLGPARFTRTRHLEDIQRVVVMFQKAGYPEARVHTSFEANPQAAFNRQTRAADFTVTVDPRRRIDVQFEGNDPDAVPEDQLREQLTFNTAASSDNVEAENSARAIVTYLQNRGWFDAHVTWVPISSPNSSVHRIMFHIDQGASLPVKEIRFDGNRALTSDELTKVIGTTQEKFSTTLFGGNTNATSAQLSADVGRIVDLYRRSGYRDATVRVEAATDPAAFGSAAASAAFSAADLGDSLHIRYVIHEGAPTVLSDVHVVVKGEGNAPHPEEAELCAIAIRELAGLYDAKLTPLPGDTCRATVATHDGKPLTFREEDAAQTRDELRGKLFNRGRPRADVGYDITATDHKVTATYSLANMQPLLIGKVVIRGNFKTRPSIILGELNLKEGAPLTQDALAEGARKLRNTALFDAVKLTVPDLDTMTSGEVNAVVEVVERYDFFTQVDAEAGYSSYNGAFLKVIPSLKNLFGIGISFDLAGTVGFDLAQYLENRIAQLRQLSAEATLRAPQWLSRRFSPVEFETDLTAFHRRQDTPRFGPVTTDGVTLSLSRTWERKHVGNRSARAITAGIHYDFRLRERTLDVLRPLGADDDQTQVPISTRTGSVGVTFEWEQRVDRNGVLSPLAAEDGFRLEAQASFASLVFGGQDTFLKLSTAGSRYWRIGETVLRIDARFDQGIPLGGAVLLPEVERFFAGGDSTVRGYNDDALATEIIRVGVPPLSTLTAGNVQQIRILPAGGNIRAMSSLDWQIPIYRPASIAAFATALFADAGLIANQWTTVGIDDIRPSVGIALFRIVTPFGAIAVERAIPLRPQLGDDPRGRWHISFAARAQF